MEITWLQFLSFFVLCSRSIPHKRTTPFPSRTHFLLFCASPVFFLLFRPNFLHYYFLSCRVRLGFFGVLPIPGIAESRQSCILVFFSAEGKRTVYPAEIWHFLPRLRLSQFVSNGLNQFWQIFWFEVFSVFQFRQRKEKTCTWVPARRASNTTQSLGVSPYLG